MKYLYKPCTFNQKVTFGKYFPCPDHSGPYDGLTYDIMTYDAMTYDIMTYDVMTYDVTCHDI